MNTFALAVSLADGEYKIVCKKSGLEVSDVEAGWSMTDAAAGDVPDSKRFTLKHIDDGQYTVISKASGKTLLLKEGELAFEVQEDPAGMKEALWRIESVDEEFDVLEFFYPSEVECTFEGNASHDSKDSATAAKQLRAGEQPTGQAPVLTADYDLADDKGHWIFVPLTQLKAGKYNIKCALDPALALDRKMKLRTFADDKKTFKWRVTPIGNGYYVLLNKAAKLAMDGGGEEVDSGSKPSLAAKNKELREQQWKIIPHAEEEGMYHICSHANFLAMDCGKNASDGAMVFLKDFAPDEPSHKWSITPCAESGPDFDDSCAEDAETDAEAEEDEEPAA